MHGVIIDYGQNYKIIIKINRPLAFHGDVDPVIVVFRVNQLQLTFGINLLID